jgi:predicted ATPase
MTIGRRAFCRAPGAGGLHVHLKQARIHQERFPTLDRYPFSLAVLQRTATLTFSSPVTFFVGENGSGKSTLLKALAVKCGVNMWQGEQRMRRSANPFETKLFQALEVCWSNGRVPGSFFDSQVFHNFAQILDDWAANDPGILTYFGGKSLMQQSHGQSLLSFFQSRFRLEGLYLLDEPETALSPRSQLALVRSLRRWSAKNRAQFIIATHSPILLACPAALILSFDHCPVQPLAYEQTDAFRIYRQFMADPSGCLAAD